MTDRYAIGLMSGTALDGIDAACCRVRCDDTGPLGYQVAVEAFHTEPYPAALRATLRDLCATEGRVPALCRMNVALGEVFAEAAERVRERAGLSTAEMTVIGSHGQTVWHAPEPKPVPGAEPVRATLQIGDGAVVAARTDVPTVSDFRAGDVAASGHGAPLAPLLDATQFAGDRSRALQNVGGIGNCTLVPPEPTLDDLVAFDTGPGNVVIDAVVERITDGRRTYDEDGELAARGTVDDGLVARLLDDEYFGRAPPKTTGREYFDTKYIDRFLKEGRNRNRSDVDLVASATALTARSIADAYERFCDPYPDEVLVSGGGAKNPVLMEMLRAAVDAPVERLDAITGSMTGDQKEAALFALLAVMRLDGVPNNVPAATGADRPVVMGKVSRP
ncbi:anhydro-N-acetylmuramic acid kinase [Halococcus agarilyticus]|uniref:anhydro-N-acetylmuramic acid kinase n=1 Tax=Halococcus agarilyticus TaxID=1232219 RepID=UPI0006779FBB|nr:anhydro-N-acetylmuramic acid kinase [Halococcus agarilyticus]